METYEGKEDYEERREIEMKLWEQIPIQISSAILCASSMPISREEKILSEFYGSTNLSHSFSPLNCAPECKLQELLGFRKDIPEYLLSDYTKCKNTSYQTQDLNKKEFVSVVETSPSELANSGEFSQIKQKIEEPKITEKIDLNIESSKDAKQLEDWLDDVLSQFSFFNALFL